MPLVVKAAVKQLLAKEKFRASEDFWKALEKHLEKEIKAAMERAKANNRRTLKACDL